MWNSRSQFQIIIFLLSRSLLTVSYDKIVASPLLNANVFFSHRAGTSGRQDGVAFLA